MRITPPALLLSITVVCSGCGLATSSGRGFGRGVIAGIALDDTSLVQIERRLADSAGVFLGRALDEAVFVPMRATWDTMASTARTAADSAASSAARRVGEDFNLAVARLLNENLDLLESRSPGLARRTATAMTEELRRGLIGALSTAADTFAVRLVTGITIKLEETFEPALHAVMQSVTDSLRRRIEAVDTTVAESRTARGLRSSATVIGAVVLLALLLGLWVHARRQRRALRAMMDAVAARQDPALDDRVQECAREAGVQGWLNARMTDRHERHRSPTR